MNRMTLKLSDDCYHEFDARTSGIPDRQTVEIYQFFPHAQRPRHQRIYQATMSQDEICRVAAWLWKVCR